MKIIFTGGGSGGHVVPALTLINRLKSEHKDIKILYIGGHDGIEKQLATKAGIQYKGIYTGKLRRYFTLQNFIDFFKVGIGLIQSIIFIFKEKDKNTLLFATGGFVAVAPVIAAKICGVKSIIHEQTSRAGLANQICAKFASKVYLTFESSKQFFPKNKSFHKGLPLREQFFSRSIDSGLFNGILLEKISRPIIFITGGGNGSYCLNKWVKESLSSLEQKYFIIHQVGKLFIDEYELSKSKNYHPVDFLGDEIIDIFKLSTFVISRAGANTVCELMSLRKKSIYIPLKIAQKNEQYHNAMIANKEIGSLVVEEDELEIKKLNDVLNTLDESEFNSFTPTGGNPVDTIINELVEEIRS